MAYPFTFQLNQEIQIAPGISIGDVLDVDCQLDLESNGSGGFYVSGIVVDAFTGDAHGQTIKTQARITGKHTLWDSIVAAAEGCDQLWEQWQDDAADRGEVPFNANREYGTTDAMAL